VPQSRELVGVAFDLYYIYVARYIGVFVKPVDGARGVHVTVTARGGC
jgi:hypothetical protein